MFEMNGYEMPYGAHVWIDGSAALRAWNKGKCTVEVGVEVAKRCADSNVLERILKDRRVAVRTAALKNPNVAWGTLVIKASWSESNERSSSVRYEARETMRRAASRAQLADAVTWLADEQTVDGYEAVFRTAKATDEDLMKCLDLVFAVGERRYEAVEGISARDDLHRRGDDVLYAIAKKGSVHFVKAASAACQGGTERVDLVWKLIDLAAETSGEGGPSASYRSAFYSFMGMRKVGAEFHERLHERLKEISYTGDQTTHMSNPESPWRLWADARIEQRGNSIDVLGKALCEGWGDNPEAWSWAGSMIGEFAGTVEEFVQMLEVFHPTSE